MTHLIMKSIKTLFESHIKGDSENDIAELLAPKQGYETLQSVQVFEDAIPDKKSDEAAYPCLVIRWVEGTEDDDSATETFEVLVCAFSDEGREIAESWAGVIAGRVRSILRQTRLIGGNRFQRVGDIKSINAKFDPGEKHFSHHYVTIRSQWQYPLPDITSMEG
ncbi:MAG TPA: hypothetical protein DCS48_05850 [Desulfovibrio sp.]|nr:hypothetical protein [Desulfovibrio sp.]